MLNCFQLLSGLKINFHKSCIYGFDDDNMQISQWANLLQCEVGIGPMQYLGTSIGVSPLSLKFWEPLINRAQVRLGS